MENEIWKGVVGYEGIYEVSDMGRVRSLNYKRSGMVKLLAISINRKGYVFVNLYRNGKMKGKKIHSLVAESFIDSDYRKNGLVVNHKNFKRDDNILSNLEIISNRENANQKHLKSTSKYTGVYLDKRSGKWLSSIYINGSTKRLGTFESEKEASYYYESALICINDGRIGDIKTKVKPMLKTSKYKHISFTTRNNMFRVAIVINGKQKHIGHFQTEEQAYSALCEYKVKNGLVN